MLAIKAINVHEISSGKWIPPQSIELNGIKTDQQESLHVFIPS